MRHILIYGSSIFLASLARQMRDLPETRVTVRQDLNDLGDVASIHAVLVDLNDPTTGNVLQLLRTRPDLKLIGVNDATGALTVLVGQVYLAHSLTDVVFYLNQV